MAKTYYNGVLNVMLHCVLRLGGLFVLHTVVCVLRYFTLCSLYSPLHGTLPNVKSCTVVVDHRLSLPRVDVASAAAHRLAHYSTTSSV